MTLSEFKAWLEGYSESFVQGAPTVEQWTKVQDKLATVDVVVLPAAPYNPPTLPWITLDKTFTTCEENWSGKI